MKLAAFVSGLALSFAAASLTYAAEFGTASEAKAMLDRAIAALKANKSDALAKFHKGDPQFKDRDLYVFCGGADGKFTAHPALMGQDMRTLKDKAGKDLGAEMYKTAEEGKIKEISYMWPRPNSTNPVQKVSYVTKVGDQICGVGYYK
jgi:signal transduction histidine kinase